MMTTPFYQNEEDTGFLCGNTFSNGRAFFFPFERNTFSRLEYIENYCSQKKVIHLGCMDHLDLIEKKMKRNVWLHQRVIHSATKCVGIDINYEAIEFCKRKYKIDNLFCADITQEVPVEIIQDTYDMILLADVIEHIPNPEFFLRSIREKLKPCVSQMLVTTPYAFKIKNFLGAFKNKENINSDHSFWFTPYTLSKLFVKAGYSVKKITFVESEYPQLAWLLGGASFCYNVLAMEVCF